jgi:hypothetical protein
MDVENKRSMNEYENWIQHFNMLKTYIDVHNKLPVDSDSDEDLVKLSSWTKHQVYNFKNKIYSMANPKIVDVWKKFTNDETYALFFISNRDLWMKHFDEFKQFIDENGKRPSSTSMGFEKQLSTWSAEQINMYPKKKKSMSDEQIRTTWHEFVNSDEYSDYFLSKDEIWNRQFDDVKKYITEHKSRPSNKSSEERVKKLGQWLAHQLCSFKKEKMAESRTKSFREFMENPTFNCYFK